MNLYEVWGKTADQRCVTELQCRFISADTKEEAKTIAMSSPIRLIQVKSIRKIK